MPTTGPATTRGHFLSSKTIVGMIATDARNTARMTSLNHDGRVPLGKLPSPISSSPYARVFLRSRSSGETYGQANVFTCLPFSAASVQPGAVWGFPCPMIVLADALSSSLRMNRLSRSILSLLCAAPVRGFFAPAAWSSASTPLSASPRRQWHGDLQTNAAAGPSVHRLHGLSGDVDKGRMPGRSGYLQTGVIG